MGQQQIMESATALRRIMLVVLVAALMALMMSVTAAPALAANGGFSVGGKNALTKSNDEAAKGGIYTALENHKNG
jgi:hypothetical protein